MHGPPARLSWAAIGRSPPSRGWGGGVWGCGGGRGRKPDRVEGRKDPLLWCRCAAWGRGKGGGEVKEANGSKEQCRQEERSESERGSAGLHCEEHTGAFLCSSKTGSVVLLMRSVRPGPARQRQRRRQRRQLISLSSQQSYGRSLTAPNRVTRASGMAGPPGRQGWRAGLGWAR